MSAWISSKLVNLLGAELNLKSVLFHQHYGLNEDFWRVRYQILAHALRLDESIRIRRMGLLVLRSGLNGLLSGLGEVDVEQPLHLGLAVLNQVHTPILLFLKPLSKLGRKLRSFDCFEVSKYTEHVGNYEILVTLKRIAVLN